MKNKNKIVYLGDGEEAELITQFQNNGKTYYVVRSLDYNYGGYEYKIWPEIYEKYEDTPTFIHRAKLEQESEELKKKIKELKEQKEKLEQELKSVYAPKYKIGTPIYATIWGHEVKELKINKIEFIELEDKSYYVYHCDYNGYIYSFEEIGGEYFLTREDAEKGRKEYLKKEKIERYEQAKKEYKKAKERLEEMKKELNVN